MPQDNFHARAFVTRIVTTLRPFWHIKQSDETTGIGTCTENYNINVSSDVDPSTNVEENDNLSCFENEIINEDNLSNVDSALGLDNDKTLNIFRQERNDFWYPPDYILDWYKKISNIHLKNDILKEIKQLE